MATLANVTLAMTKTNTLALLGATLVLLSACNKEPPCKAGTLPDTWKAAPLDAQVPTGEVTICESATDTEATFWVQKTVHDANMASVSRAQDNGWDRTSDNWYSSKGDFNTPKWSEFKNATGKLRVDVREQNGGATIVVKHTPGG